MLEAILFFRDLTFNDPPSPVDNAVFDDEDDDDAARLLRNSITVKTAAATVTPGVILLVFSFPQFQKYFFYFNYILVICGMKF